MFITPVKKPGKAKSKSESYGAVALTSHIGKVIEKVITEDLQTF